jgi:hypothetical protein
MSRFYGMSIKITGHDEKKAHAIFKAIKKEWDFQDEFFHDITAQEDEPRFLSAYGESYLCGGESEDQFTDRIALAVWKANGGYCHHKTESLVSEANTLVHVGINTSIVWDML